MATNTKTEPDRFAIDLICEDNRCGGTLTVTVPWRTTEVAGFHWCPDCDGEMEVSERRNAVRPLSEVI